MTQCANQFLPFDAHTPQGSAHSAIRISQWPQQEFHSNLMLDATDRYVNKKTSKYGCPNVIAAILTLLVFVFPFGGLRCFRLL